MPQNPWPCVLFDFDGTVANTIELCIVSYRHALREVLGEERDETEMRSWIGQPLSRTFRDLAPERVEELLTSYTQFNWAHTDDYIRPYAGMDTLLGDLTAAGVATGIVTSKRRHPAEMGMRALGLDGLVPLVVAMEDTDIHKPQPEPLLLGASRLEHEAGGAAYVGDAVVDVQAAYAAGMAPVAVTWGAGRSDLLRDAAPAHLVSSVDELRGLLLA
ncbi:HAD family hydrolase [Actinomycetota bacterium]